MGVTAVLAGIGLAAGVGTAIMGAKQAHDQKKEAQRAAANVPVYNAQAEKQKAANQEAEANRRRVMSETNTVQTTALGNAGATELKKKTLLGG